jgi:phosphohistidine phosphatase
MESRRSQNGNRMRRLMLLRHAKALRAQGVADFDRPLQAAGREEARWIGEFMAAQGLEPGLALVSSALRARETFDLIDIFLHPPPERVDEPLIYEATAEVLFDIVRSLPRSQRCVLVVGHNPAFEELADELIAAGDEDALAHFRRPMPTGALAVIDFKTKRWGKIKRRTGLLAFFVTPAQAEAKK